MIWDFKDGTQYAVRKELQFWLDWVTDFPGKRNFNACWTVHQWELPSPRWLAGEELWPFVSLCSESFQDTIEILQVQLFYADVTPGLGESSCCPVLIKFLAHSAQLLLPRENWWVLFRLFAGLDSPSAADHCPSPGRGVLSIMTRYCCWYFIYYQFFITENHFI